MQKVPKTGKVNSAKDLDGSVLLKLKNSLSDTIADN